MFHKTTFIYSNYTINNNCKVIANRAFYECTRLSSIEIPDSVTGISDSAFLGCSSLKTINYSGTKAQWEAISKGSGWASGVDATVYCSDGTISI